MTRRVVGGTLSGSTMGTDATFGPGMSGGPAAGQGGAK